MAAFVTLFVICVANTTQTAKNVGDGGMENIIKVDPRTKKTKRAIRNALAQLLSEKDMNDITVKEIAAYAEINRKTFYCYYNGIYQVVDEIENEIVIAFESIMNEVDIRQALIEPYMIFERLTSVINTDIDFYGHLLNDNLTNKIVQVLVAKTKEALLQQVNLDEQKADVILQFTITGMVAVYQQWYHSNRNQSIEELAEIIGIMSFQGFSGILEKYDKSLLICRSS